jgi:hypothetical protein
MVKINGIVDQVKAYDNTATPRSPIIGQVS